MGAGAVLVLMIFFSMGTNVINSDEFGKVNVKFVELGLIDVIRAMQIIVLADANSRDELLSGEVEAGHEIIWISGIDEFATYPNADACIDLLFQAKPENLSVLSGLKSLVIVNSVAFTLKELHPDLIRINGWPTFLKSSILEAASSHSQKEKSEKVLSVFQKKIQWLPDEPGFVIPRVVSMIINEAFLSLKEGVSTKEAIDIAMKLGTNYPYGPFEWADRIGKEKIAELLSVLSRKEARYAPASGLRERP